MNATSRRLAFAAALIGAGLTVQSASAAKYNEAILAKAGVISRAQAVAIAEQAVGVPTTLIGAQFEKTDHIPHWSVDLLGQTYEYEVWVSTSGNVLRVITQPR